MPEYLSAEEIAALLRDAGDDAVSARTVHYYAEQKLLPPPEYDGTRPRYSVAHLDAMREARRRKREGQRLREIAPMVARVTAGPAPPDRPSVPFQRPLPSAPVQSGVRTIAIAPGLTLAAQGWSDEVLRRIVHAVEHVLAARDDSRKGES